MRNQRAHVWPRRDIHAWPGHNRRRIGIAGGVIVLAVAITPALFLGSGPADSPPAAANAAGLTTWSRPEAKSGHGSSSSDHGDNGDDKGGSSGHSSSDSSGGGGHSGQSGSKSSDKSTTGDSGSDSSSDSRGASGGDSSEGSGKSSGGGSSGKASGSGSSTGSGAGSSDAGPSSSSTSSTSTNSSGSAGQSGGATSSAPSSSSAPANPSPSGPAGSSSSSTGGLAPSIKCPLVVYDDTALRNALAHAAPNAVICYGKRGDGSTNSAGSAGSTNSTGSSASPSTQSPVQVCPPSASCRQSNHSSGTGASSGGQSSSIAPRSAPSSSPAPRTDTSGGSNASASDLASVREILRQILASPWLSGAAGGGLSIPIPNLPATAGRSLQRDSTDASSDSSGGSSGDAAGSTGQGDGSGTSASSRDQSSGESDGSDHGDSGSSDSSSGGDTSRHQRNSASGSQGSGGSLGDAVNDTTNTVSGAASKILGGQPEETVLHTTGYSFQDNTPPNSNTISCGIIHKVAGGKGTYDDPITVAVPGSGGKGAQIPCGTRIYYKIYRLYGLVEDTGATNYGDAKHTDIYVDGQGISKQASDKCMDPVTTPDGSPTPAILNPPANLPVRAAGPITTANGCDVGGGS